MFIEIPMTEDPSQQFVAAINNVKYQFKIDLNTRGSQWSLSINTELGEPMIQGAAMVLGANLLSNNRFLHGILYLVDYSGKGIDPNADNLSNFGLVWSDE